MAIVRLVTSTKASMLAELLADIDAGHATVASGATIKLYTGIMPASPSVAVTSQVLLGTLTCSFPAGSIASGVLTFNPITSDAAADADGTATWARISDSTGLAVLDCDVSPTTGTGSIKLNTTAIKAGGPLAITACVMSLP